MWPETLQCRCTANGVLVVNRSGDHVIMTSLRVRSRYPQAGSFPFADRISLRLHSMVHFCTFRTSQMAGTLYSAQCIPKIIYQMTFANLWHVFQVSQCPPLLISFRQILRVAAHNHAKFEWIHHEPVARDSGMSTLQLSIIRDTLAPPPSTSAPAPLTPLQAAAISFADASAKLIHVPNETISALTQELGHLVIGTGDGKKEKVEDLLVECAAVVATYDMVSRFFVSLNVAGMSNDPVPHPVDRTEVRPSHISSVLTQQFSHSRAPCDPSLGTLHAETLTISPTSPWPVFSNSS